MAEHSIENNGGDKGGDADTSVHPDKLGVMSDRDEGHVDGSAKSVGEKVHALNKRFHRWRSLGVGILETGDGEENLGNADKDVRGSLDGNVNVVRHKFAVDQSGCALLRGTRKFVARSRTVDQVLNNGSIGKAQRSEEKADTNTSDWAQLDASFAEQGIDNSVQNWGEDENRNRVKVLHEIVGHAVTLHLFCLRDKVGRKLTVTNPKDRVKDKDLAGTETTLDLVDKVVIPRNWLVLAIDLSPGRLGSVVVSVDNHDTNGLEGISNDGTLRGANNVRVAADNEDEDTNVKHAEAHEERSPEALVLFQEGGRHE